MQIIQRVSRLQIRFSSLDRLISTDNVVRLIDAFVEKLYMDKLSFISRDTPKTCKDQRQGEGRRSYHLVVFLKLNVYDYLNGVHCSRRLERNCGKNIELHWLLEGLVPNCHSIGDFRKDKQWRFSILLSLLYAS